MEVECTAYSRLITDETKGLLQRVHSGYVQNRRARALSAALGEFIPSDARVLDVGCGDGLIDKLIAESRPDLSLQGIDVLIRHRIYREIRPFDGLHLPFGDCSFDAVMLVDVMHHSEEPRQLVAEAKRVATGCIVIKDVMREGFLSEPTLRLMDRIGNERFGVACRSTFGLGRSGCPRSTLSASRLKRGKAISGFTLGPPIGYLNDLSISSPGCASPADGPN